MNKEALLIFLFLIAISYLLTENNYPNTNLINKDKATLNYGSNSIKTNINTNIHSSEVNHLILPENIIKYIFDNRPSYNKEGSHKRSSNNVLPITGNPVFSGNSITGYQIFSESNQSGPEAIAVWAYPDGVSIPYRDDNNQIVNGNVHIGVVAYHSTGINRIEFNIDGTNITQTIYQETINPETNEYEYVFDLDPSLLQEGRYNITAVAYPNNGTAHTLPKLLIQKDTQVHRVWYVDAINGNDTAGNGSLGKPYATVTRAIGTEWGVPTWNTSAQSGDLIIVFNGTYAFPSGMYGGYREPNGTATYGHFSKYVTIKAARDNNVILNPSLGYNQRSRYIKYDGVTFNGGGSVLIYDQTHIWFNKDVFIGAGHNVTDSSEFAVAVYNSGGYVTVENSEIKEHGAGVLGPGSSGNQIVRNIRIHDMASDGIEYSGNEILITGNDISNVKAPPNGTQHTDTIATHFNTNNVVIRNNYGHNNSAQGLFLSRGEGIPNATIRRNTAVINNVFGVTYSQSFTITLNARHQDQSPDPSDENAYIYNMLFEYNTVYPVYAPLRIEYAPGYSDNVTIRNNIFGNKSIGNYSYVPWDIDYNLYSPPTLLGQHSLFGNPNVTDENNWDFSLLSNSPAINKADTSSGIKYDINWNLRDSQPDIGAYEYISGNITNTCSNGIQDGDETGIDCGGSCPNACISDTIYPQFTNLNEPIDPAIYSYNQVYNFNATITNTNGIVGIEFNGVNYSVTNPSPNIYSFSIDNLGAGTYSYYWYSYGNGINHLYNITSIQTYTINKAIPTILVSSSNGWNINYPDSTTLSGNGCPILGASDIVCTLYKDTNVIFNPTTAIYGAGSYIIEYDSIDGQNYSSASAQNTLTVNNNSIYTISLTAIPSWTVAYGTQTTVTGSNCPNELVCNLYRNNILVNNPDIQILKQGNYAYAYNTTGNANYTSKQTTSTLNVKRKFR